MSKNVKKSFFGFHDTEEILNLLDEGILVLDSKFHITYANTKAYDLLKNEIKTKKKKPKKSSKENSNLIDLCKELAKKVSFKKEHKKVIYLQKKLDFFLQIRAIFRKSKKDVLIIFQDKTSEYKMLTMGKDFVTNASHELRTPLTIIKGYSETLNDFSKLSKNIIKSIIEKIIKTSFRLENIISDLLTLANIENLQTLSFCKCDLKKVIQSSVDMVLLANKHAKIRLDFSKKEEMIVFAEAGLLEMAFKNLLENAVKYSKKIPNIFLSLKKEKNKVVLSIKDNGIGISKRDLPFIFDRFFTVDKARSRKHGGTGLGLSLVKNIIEKHQGNIEVSSKLKEGTIFQLRLPLFLDK